MEELLMDPRLSPLRRPSPEEMIGKQTGKVQPKPTLCPFGCGEDDPSVNDHGYCKHLAGWSTDGKTFERRERVINTSSEICRGPHPINNDVHTCVQMSFGLRVYSRLGKAPVLIARPLSEAVEVEVPDEVPDEEAALEELTRPDAVTA